MAAIVPAVPAAVDGIATPGMVTACAADVASASIAANQASPFASARRIAIVTTTGDVTAMATGATVDRRRGAGQHPALFYCGKATPAGDAANPVLTQQAFVSNMKHAYCPGCSACRGRAA